MTPSGIETATFRFVAQHLNHCTTDCTTAVPESHLVQKEITSFSRHSLTMRNYLKLPKTNPQFIIPCLVITDLASEFRIAD